MRMRPILTVAAVGTAATAVGSALAVRAVGRRIDQRVDPGVDAILTPPADTTHHRMATFDGGSLHVAEWGEGTPVVLLHGVTLQWWVWAPLFHLLGADHRVIAWDMRGHGESRAGDEGVSLSAVATDLVTVLSDLQLENAVVVGHSMGGMGLGRFCIDHPITRDRRVGHAVYLATSAAPLHPVLPSSDSRMHKGFARFATLGMESPVRYEWGDNALSRVLLRRTFGTNCSGAAVEELRKMVAEMSPESLAEAGQSIANHDIRDELLEVELPATVITGTADILTPPRHARILAGSLPDSELHLLDGVGHQVMQEVPHELAQLLRTVAAHTGRDSAV